MACKYHKNDNCICKRVKNIADQQQEAINDCCDVSCETSLDQLVNPTTATNNFNTVPFMLLTESSNTLSGLVPYFAWGVNKEQQTTVPAVNGNPFCSTPFVSPFFRVKKMVGECCAVLELLCPVFCDDINTGVIETFTRTGACVEVDLRDFTGLTCFPPVNAEQDDCVCDILSILFALYLGPIGSIFGIGDSCENSPAWVDTLKGQFVNQIQNALPQINLPFDQRNKE